MQMRLVMHMLLAQILSNSEEIEAISCKIFENEATRGGSRPGVGRGQGWVAAARAPLDISREKKEKKNAGPVQPPSSMRPGILYSVRDPPLSDDLEMIL